MKMFKSKFFLLIINLLLGILVVSQINTVRIFSSSSDWQKEQNLTWRIILLNQKIYEKQNTINNLKRQKERYQKNLITQSELRTTIIKEIELYQKFLGEKEARGPGVILNIYNLLSLEEMVDLVNTLKNIGAEGISINQKRLIYNSSFSQEGKLLKMNGEEISPPYTIKVIGNPDILLESLSRKEGVIERLKTFSRVKTNLEKYNQIILPAVNDREKQAKAVPNTRQLLKE